MKQKLYTSIIPLSLLAALFVIALATVFIQADTYGITADERLQDSYGRSLLLWYQTDGRDQSFLTTYNSREMPQHGAIFEVIVAEAQQLFGDPWHTRAIVNGLAGVVGIGAIALCGFELGGWWAAFLAALGLWLYPRFFGAIFNNSKDIPFAAAIALVLWSILVLVRQWNVKRKYVLNSSIVGFLIGVATSIRVTALFWYPLLVLLLAGWWIHSGRSAFKEKKVLRVLVKQATAGAIIALVSFSTMIVCWPYIALNPLHNLYDSLLVMNKYPWGGVTLFAGHLYAGDVPARYAPVWLVIGSPPATILLAGVGGIVACVSLVKRKVIEPKIAIICLTLFLPLGVIIALRSVLYDTLRQILFLIPPLLLLAVYGFLGLFTFLKRRKQHVAVVLLVILALASQLQVIQAMANLHPYEYAYFSPLVGGVPGANGQYEIDYWGICNKPAAEWLARNYRQYTAEASPTVMSGLEPVQVTHYLPDNFKYTADAPDFYISTTRFALDQKFPSYQVIHTETLQGYVACVVKVKPALADTGPYPPRGLL